MMKVLHRGAKNKKESRTTVVNDSRVGIGAETCSAYARMITQL